MAQLKKYKWALLVLALHLAATLWFAGQLPDDTRVPIHWNIHNEIDGWSGKTFGLWWGLALNAIMFLALWLLPWYSPWYRKYEERFDAVLPPLTTTLVFFFALISLYALAVAKWGDIGQVNMILILMGLLCVLLGNLLPKVPKNFFIGIKTPWTLSNEEVWNRTHRLGGILFVLGGLLLMLKGFILPKHSGFQLWSAVLAFGLLLYPVLHSFILFKRLGKDG